MSASLLGGKMGCFLSVSPQNHTSKYSQKETHQLVASIAAGCTWSLHDPKYKWVHDPFILGNDQPFLKGHGDSR